MVVCMTDSAASGTWKRRTTLLACFLHFDFSFMLWVLIGALGIPLAEAAQLSPAEKGFVVALPILAGSLMRIPIGLLVDRLGGKRIGVMLLAFLFFPLALAWQLPPSLPTLIVIGALLGFAGASFAVALPLASRWFPPDRQGLAMGIAAAGNSGTVVTNLVAPRLVAAFGLGATFGIAMIGLAGVLLAFALLAHEPPRKIPPAPAKLPSLRDRDLRWMCLFYAITFGGYVGLSSFLPLFLRDNYGLSAIQAGYITAGLACAGSLARPIGGIISDRLGGTRVLAFLLIPIAGLYAFESTLPPLPLMVAGLAGSMLCLGLGNGAVFQIVPQRFGRNLGAVTGLIGALGGIGGFLLPMLLGGLRGATGSFGYGFAILALLAGVAAVAIRVLTSARGRWAEIVVPVCVVALFAAPARAEPIAPPPPYALGWSLRPVQPVNVVRSDTSIGLFDDGGMAGSTVASTFLASYKLTPTLAPLFRIAVVRHDPAMGASASAISNPLLGVIWSPAGIRAPFKVGVFGGLALPLGSGGGNSPDMAALGSIRAAAIARSSMDNAMFAVNDLTPIAGADLAYVAHGLTIQAEVTLFELIRARGSSAQPDAFKTNVTTGLHAGYFLLPQLSASGELRYQRYLSTPSFVELDPTGASRDAWSAAIGLRAHVALGGTRWLRPGLSYARGLDEPAAHRRYQSIQIDVPFVF